MEKKVRYYNPRTGESGELILLGLPGELSAFDNDEGFVDAAGAAAAAPVQSVDGGTGTVDTWKQRYLGANAVSSPNNDTVSTWANLGQGWSWYNTAGQIYGQPSTWGFLFNYVNVAKSDVFQIWHTQPAGYVYQRGGNGSTPFNAASWKLIADENSIQSLAFSTMQTTDIPANSNLDNYKTLGNYNSPNAATSATITNAPITSSGFVLFVMRHNTGGNIYQFLIANATTLGIYSRMYTTSTSTWNSWNRLARASELKTFSVSNTNGSAVSTASGTAKTVQEVTLTAGTYILECAAEFASNATGYRNLRLSTTNNGGALDRYSARTVQAANGSTTRIGFTYPVTLSATTTYYLVAQQNSGGNLNVTPGYRYLKIS